MCFSKGSSASGDFPIIDFSQDDAVVAREVTSACQTHGFFIIVNHGMPSSVTSALFQESSKFFALEPSLKEAISMQRNPKGNRGYIPPNQEGLNNTSKSADTKECLNIGVEIPQESELAKQHPLCAPNLWPDEATLPDFREATQSYFNQVLRISSRLLRFFCIAVGAEETEADRFFDPVPSAFLRLLRYVPPQDPPDSADHVDIPACGAHTDFGMFTLLCADSEGLQILRQGRGLERAAWEGGEGDWENVPMVPGGLVVNVGDLLQRWSNDRILSTPHRVMQKTGGTQARHSAALFVSPWPETEICPVVLGGEEKGGQSVEKVGAKYSPITAGEYLAERFRACRKQVFKARMGEGKQEEVVN
uniref:Fe2OG dioxygenase domain-containing protein n=1 Tax=Chromera velia CCMP2878 TaxID=1169474 RepID=A0A0G4FV80_9ALVE|eukprot:Cvel_18814.t1-p1 / transcript=Cvel_18814.t1 / gene=Cvel_18814 / organism=Chromera_velia_CCMP2878 / gene_product=UPF0676 protein C1494.01, putative / transcript_product=UPF0676 protein C1494.01, putative / location=Cvel_scaffold1580:14473-15555(+) / protein_length=361 / sequence_SO=supercontig / SO=protein_coding / is_pseudo=false